jgi:hypothetical protein
VARKSPNRIVKAVADVMWKRDQLQMRAVDALLSSVEPKTAHRASPARRRRPAAKGRR